MWDWINPVEVAKSAYGLFEWILGRRAYPAFMFVALCTGAVIGLLVAHSLATRVVNAYRKEHGISLISHKTAQPLPSSVPNRQIQTTLNDGYRPELGIRGPDNLTLRIYPEGGSFFGSLEKHGQTGVGAIGLSSIEYKTAEGNTGDTFRDPVPFRHSVCAFKAIEAGGREQFEFAKLINGNIELATQTHGSLAWATLRWPPADNSAVRVWSLEMQVTGLSTDWPISLRIRHDVASRKLDFREFTGD